MKNFLMAMVALFCFIGLARADEMADVKKFSVDMINHFQNDIFRSDMPRDKKIQKFDEDFILLFDLDYIVPVVMGPAAKVATDSEKAEFKRVFTEFNLTTFANYFDDYATRDFNLISVTPAKTKGQYFVKMSVVNPKNTNDVLNLQWRFKKEGSGFKIVDAVIAEVSMVMNYRTEYGNIYKQAEAAKPGSGVEVLIGKIRAKNAQIKK